MAKRSGRAARRELWQMVVAGALALVAGGALAGMVKGAQGQTQATTVALMLPSGVAYDAAGDLLFSEAAQQVVRRVTPAGVLSTVAGTGAEGFGGDGGAATAAMLDTPGALAVDAAGNLFLADTHNRRIRRVDAGTGVMTTAVAGVSASALAFDANGELLYAESAKCQVWRVDLKSGSAALVAGSGVQGFGGDGGAAVAAELDTPEGLAVDAAGDVLVADAHNHRVRRVDAGTGVITTVARSDAPGGLVVDAGGGVVFADRALHQVVRVALPGAAGAGAVTVVAGTGREGFAGDGGPAVEAALDEPRAVALSAGGLVTLTDEGNGRVRQVDGAGVIHTIAGLGATASATLTLHGPAVMQYGSTGTPVVATLVASAATGTVTFFDAGAEATPVTLATVALSGNAAVLATGGLGAGAHRLTAAYSGDAGHGAAESAGLALTVVAAPAVAAPNAVAVVYGQAVPALTGTLTGTLARDAVGLALSSGAVVGSAPGSYGISAALTGASAADYALTTVPAAVTVAQAPVAVSLAQVSVQGTSQGLTVTVASTTSGVPTGNVTLLDGNASFATAALVGGSAAFSSAGLANGSHTLTARYGGDVDFLPGNSAAAVVTVGPGTLPDFALTVSGAGTQTVAAGGAAQYSFAVTPSNGALASPIVLAASGLPPNATASFNPAYLPPSGAPSAFVLTVTTPRAAVRGRGVPWVLAFLLPVAWLARARRRRLLGLGALLLLAGCGDRINHSETGAAVASYTITVTATATQSSGATLEHAAVVTLNVQ